MAYSVRVEPAAAKTLARIPQPDRDRIRAKIDALAETPRPVGCAKLQGEDNAYRIRSGNWRILYAIHDQVLLVLVFRIAHRREAYR